ncbi:sulfite exporter TauE/SafE family protein [Guptibacillus hwajinpoensis]|uniref:urease accessory protein UreH domain-containing protein n=1 Tax=Guptibacillus hwajinpoensis TaxID=208199 RepID=UPI001CFEB274|nr:sulfite exporter TauE/SafE family protein [Pseudalkalibacillus hwajinpoensis]
MISSLTSVLFLGLILGIKHSIEPDHVIAVSTIASETKKWWRSSLAGVFWGIGHTMTLFIVGMIVILMKGEIPEAWAVAMEFLVGVMLVYLGFKSVLMIRKHTERHEKNRHAPFIKSTAIGFVHGLAGSAAMVLLTMSSVTTIGEGALYMLVFGAGTVIGMLGFTTIIGIPFVLSKNKVKINNNLTRLTGVVSMLFGVYYMYSVW